MLDYEKRLVHSFNKLSYEQQKEVLEYVERKNTMFDNLNNDNNDNSLIKLIIDLIFDTLENVFNKM